MIIERLGAVLEPKTVWRRRTEIVEIQEVVGNLVRAVRQGGQPIEWPKEAFIDYFERVGAPFPVEPLPFSPIPMLLWCPGCGERHIDKGEFTTKAHHTHACQSCGICWRPAIVDTVGVQFLPGFKDKTSSERVK